MPRERRRVVPAFDADAHVSGVRLLQPTRFRRRAVGLTLVALALGAAAVAGGYAVKTAQDGRLRAVALTSGDPDLGWKLTQRYGCAGCHIIPGVPGAKGRVGPSLEGFAARVYVGGVATNSPHTLIQWIENPKVIDPKTAMPATGISHEEARHVAAYLYTLR